MNKKSNTYAKKSAKNFLKAALLSTVFVCALTLFSCNSPVLDSSKISNTASISKNTSLSADASWLAESNIYQIFPAKFSVEGNLDGVTNRVDYLKKLGVKTIWLMPIFEAQNSHGYNCTNYYKISSNYGDLDALNRLTTKAHAEGMRVVLDLVINHSGTQIEWFSSPDASKRHDNWYIWADKDLGWNDPWVMASGSTEENPKYDSSTSHYNATWFKDPYADYDRNGNGNAHDDDYYYSVFGDGGGATMPDLNWNTSRTALTNEVVNIMQYWISNAGVDGYRCDAARYLAENGSGQTQDQALTHEIWADLRAKLNAFAPGAVLIAEAPTEYYSQMKAYYGTEAKPEFHSAFHFKLPYQLMDTIKNEGYNSSFWKDVFAVQTNLPKKATDAIFLSNHDAFNGSRVATQLSGNTAKIKMAASLYLLLSGDPVLYYGEEYGMKNVSGLSGDDAIRGSIDWTEIENQKRDSTSVLNHYKALLTLRNTYAALRGGISFVADCKGDGYTTTYTSAGNHMAYIREWYGEKILVVNNLSNHNMDISVNLSSSGLTFTDGTEVSALMGEGSYALINAQNKTDYNVGNVNAYSTKVLFLGKVKNVYGDNFTSYEKAKNASWTDGEFQGNYPSMYLRGTMNGWTKSAMKLVDNNKWALSVALNANTNYTYKFDAYGNWALASNFGDTNKDGTCEAGGSNIEFKALTQGTYTFTFNDATKTYTVASDGDEGDDDDDGEITEGNFTIIFKAGASNENVSLPGDANNWLLNANSFSVGPNTSKTISFPLCVKDSVLALGNSTSALELKLVTNASWTNQWSFSSWTVGSGISLTDSGRQIGIACASGNSVTLTIDVGARSLSVTVVK